MAGQTATQLGITAPSGGFEDNGWYNGRNYDAATQTFGDPGQIWSGKSSGSKGSFVSNEVISQTDPSNVAFIQAQQMQAGVQVPYSSGASASFVNSLNDEAAKAKQSLQDELKRQQDANNTKLTELRGKEQETLNQVGEVTKPFREDLEASERERLHINENFEANQDLVDELDTLLTQGNDLIRQQQEVTGLSAVRNPRIQQTMNDVAARAGVIQAVMNARNGQIAQAETMIDRSVNAINADRQDQLTYYNAILSLANRDILSLDADNKQIAQEQVDILKNDLNRANATVDYVKQLMLDPASAQLMGEAGVTLNDSVETINSKLSQASYNREVQDITNDMAKAGASIVYDPSGIPSSELVTLTDSQGKAHYFRTKPKAATEAQTIDSFYQALSEMGSDTSSSGSTPPQGPFRLGALWVDPDTGTVWQFTNQGWRRK